MCNRCGDNLRMVEETEEQKCIRVIICYGMGVIVYNNCCFLFSSVTKDLRAL